MPDDLRILELREKAGRARRIDHLMGSDGWKDALAILRELIVDCLKQQNARGASLEQVQRAAGGVEALQDFAQALTNTKVDGELAMEEYARLETEVPA